jgi:hypothetical protein
VEKRKDEKLLFERKRGRDAVEAELRYERAKNCQQNKVHLKNGPSAEQTKGGSLIHDLPYEKNPPTRNHVVLMKSERIES